MTQPVVDAAMEDLRSAHRALLGVVDSLADADWARCVPYGDWTVKDTVAHCIGDMSPSGVGLILAGVLTPQFIEGTAQSFDTRARNAAMVAERRDYSREDLRQMLFRCHDAMHAAALKLTEEHLPVLQYTVPMGPDYDLKVEDWLWHGYHDRQHADDIRAALAIDWRPQPLQFLSEIEERFRLMHRHREGMLRAVYSVADDAWNEESSTPGWTYKDVLAHVASNDLRHQIRIRALLGDRDEAAMESLKDGRSWNQRRVEERRDRSVRDLIDEMAALRHETIRLLSQAGPQHLAETITLPDGANPRLPDYVQIIGEHEARRAGQLVTASKARRWQPQ